jgi:hypothetical protein
MTAMRHPAHVERALRGSHAMGITELAVAIVRSGLTASARVNVPARLTRRGRALCAAPSVSAVRIALPPCRRTNPVLASGLLAPFVAWWPQVLKHSSPSFRSQAMRPSPPEHGPPPDGRDWRDRKAMEELMRLLTIAELMRLTRTELCDLLRWIINLLTTLPEGSAARRTALINLRNIRYVMARRDLSP